jgi:hypothetical protein
MKEQDTLPTILPFILGLPRATAPALCGGESSVTASLNHWTAERNLDTYLPGFPLVELSATVPNKEIFRMTKKCSVVLV